MTHSDLINLWPSIADFARDLGVSYEAAKAMRRRGSVPGVYWRAMVLAAGRREIAVTYDQLADIAAGAVDAAVAEPAEAAE